MSGPRRLRDDPAFKGLTGVDFATEPGAVDTAGLALLRRRVLSAVESGARPRFDPVSPAGSWRHVLAALGIAGLVCGSAALQAPAVPPAPAIRAVAAAPSSVETERPEALAETASAPLAGSSAPPQTATVTAPSHLPKPAARPKTIADRSRPDSPSRSPSRGAQQMPRRLLAATISAGVLTLGLSPALSAPTKRPEKSRFYEFSGGLAFEVTRKIPTLDLFRLKLDPNFGRMLSLKKDLVPGIFTARSAPVFK